MTHIMLDLETLGTKPGCVILSIGACVFHPSTGPEDGKDFYESLDRSEQKQVGLIEDHDTMLWWTKQNAKAWEQATLNPQPVKETLMSFNKWWHQHRGKWMWSQGSNFDGPLAERLFESFGVAVPWKFYNTRDTRTVYQMTHVTSADLKREGTYHNALDDAKYQARLMALGISKIRLDASATII